jgi:hypothetical protein
LKRSQNRKFAPDVGVQFVDFYTHHDKTGRKHLHRCPHDRQPAAEFLFGHQTTTSEKAE